MAQTSTKPADKTAPIRTEAAASLSGRTAGSFPGYPLTKHHPVLGARTANDPNEGASLFQPDHDWWPTAAEADMHRTEREAMLVQHHNSREKLNGIADLQDGAPPVRNSAQAQESLDQTGAEPL